MTYRMESDAVWNARMARIDNVIAEMTAQEKIAEMNAKLDAHEKILADIKALCESRLARN